MTSESTISWEAAVERLRADPGANALVRACYYDDPLLVAAQRFFESSEWNATKVLLPPPGRALEIGAGRGIAAYALAREGWHVTALEPDLSAVVGSTAIRGLARDSGLSIEVVETWGESLPFAASSFDMVYCRAVLHHARDLATLCREVARVLRPNGLFVAVREHVISREEDLQTFLDAHPLHRLYGGENAYLLEQYLACIRNAGLEVSSVLGPFSSDINLFPDSKQTVKKRIAARLHLPTGDWIPDAVLSLMDWLAKAPGRHYSFLAGKPEQATS